MIYLLLSILLSASLFVCFKWFDLRKVKLLPAICGNYLACILCGWLFDGLPALSLLSPVFLAACSGLGILFFCIFYAMGHASSAIGVGISSAAAKLSLIIPVLYGALILQETFGPAKIISVFLVIPAILMMSHRPGEKMTWTQLGLPLLIFIGSGVIDTALNVLQSGLNGVSGSVIIIPVFCAALLSALLFTGFKSVPVLGEYRSLAHGILLGIPNYFSVYFLLKALSSSGLNSGPFYLVNNAGVMLLSFASAAVLFSEKITRLKAGGLALAGLSIYLILFG